MIKLSELRFCNWVDDDGVFVRVDKAYFSYLLDYPITNRANPIPLTPEILEKCGWVWNEECNSFEKYPNGDARMNLQKKFNGGYTMFNYVIKALICENIWHLHQLQNLYFALTGTELEISL